LQLELLLLLTARARQPGSPSERRALASFERCRHYLDTQFLAIRTLEEAAAACHVDVSYLCRLFRRFSGEKPFRYLQRLQMQWAAERLHSSGRLVRQVADELGVDPFQFSRTFKRIHGVSPSTFLSTRG
jgi:AraC-like DNA-binding protein